MNENFCAVCHKPIIGYWHEVGKNCICQECAATTTVYNLYMLDLISIKPEIIEVEATLVTKDDEQLKTDMAEKIRLNSEYGMAVKAIEGTDDASGEQVEKFFTSQEPAFNN